MTGLPFGHVPKTNALALAAALSVACLASTSHAEVTGAVHAEGAAAARVGSGDSDANRFGWGAAGFVAPELRLGALVGVELPVGAVGLTDAQGAASPGVAEKGGGTALLALPGLRAWPLAAAGHDRGLWLAGGGGISQTGDLTRPALDVRLGFDVDAGPAALGPYAGLVQIVQPDDELDGGDGRVALLGLHAVYDGGIQKAAQDRDGDGIIDQVDRCPQTPEDFDGYKDDDGCPEADNDKDGIADSDDACPLDPEDEDGFQDHDGCPEVDNDQDRIVDTKDACPDEPEDMDGFADADGCPELDNDEDGFVDAVDECPDEPETDNGYMDEDGCPDTLEVSVRGDHIFLNRRVHFGFNQTEIQPQSEEIVSDLATFLIEHSEYALVHIEGHADSVGDANYNYRLSEMRAVSVKAMLIKFGVSPERLTVDAYGETKPADKGYDLEAMSKNRRVEFQILRRAPSEERPGPSALLPTKAAFKRTLVLANLPQDVTRQNGVRR